MINYLISIVCFIAGAALAGFIVYSKMKIQLEIWRNKYDLEKQTSEQYQKNINEHQNKMTLQFENLAQKIFDEKSNKFSDQNQKQLSNLLDPLKERIKDFEKR